MICTLAFISRAKKHGGKPSDYTKLFTEHAECALKKREADTLALMRRVKKGKV